MAVTTGLIAAASAVSALSGIFGGIAANQEAQAQSRIAEQQSQIASQAATQSLAETEERVVAQKREVRQFRARQLVGFLKSGVRLTGTPLQVLEETERLGAEDVGALRRAGRARAEQFRGQAGIFQQQAETARTVGRSRLFAGLAGGITSGIGFGTRLSKLVGKKK